MVSFFFWLVSHRKMGIGLLVMQVSAAASSCLVFATSTSGNTGLAFLASLASATTLWFCFLLVKIDCLILRSMLVLFSIDCKCYT